MPILDEKRGEAIAKKKHPSESRSKPGWSTMQSHLKTIIYFDEIRQHAQKETPDHHKKRLTKNKRRADDTKARTLEWNVENTKKALAPT